MTIEQYLQKANQLAQALVSVDDNEVKKIYGFLCRQHQMCALHELIKALPTSPFKDRSKKTPHYYKRMQEVIPRYLPETMEVDDAIQILGWACRLLKYEALRRERQSQMRTNRSNTRSRRERRRRR